MLNAITNRNPYTIGVSDGQPKTLSLSTYHRTACTDWPEIHVQTLLVYRNAINQQYRTLHRYIAKLSVHLSVTLVCIEKVFTNVFFSTSFLKSRAIKSEQAKHFQITKFISDTDRHDTQVIFKVFSYNTHTHTPTPIVSFLLIVVFLTMLVIDSSEEGVATGHSGQFTPSGYLLFTVVSEDCEMSLAIRMHVSVLYQCIHYAISSVGRAWLGADGRKPQHISFVRRETHKTTTVYYASFTTHPSHRHHTCPVQRVQRLTVGDK